MHQNTIDIINREFKPEERDQVTKQLMSILPDHVMAGSEWNLRNTRLSILKLAKGDVNQIIEYTRSAKIDFRDVILWATEVQ